MVVLIAILARHRLTVSRFWGTWVLLELSTLRFVAYLSRDYLVKRQVDVLMFLLIQAFRGMTIFWSLLSLGAGASIGLEVWLAGVLLLKIGAMPLHGWFISLRTKIRWESLYLFLTVQKVIPLYLLRGYYTSFLRTVILLTWALAGIGRLKTKGVKKLFVYSSLFFMGLLLGVLFRRHLWLKLLLAYALIGFPVFVHSKTGANKYGGERWNQEKSRFKYVIWFVFLNMGGVPPLPGFFLKIRFLNFFRLSLATLLGFVVGSALLIYMYLSLSFLSLVGRGSKEELAEGKLSLLPVLRFQLWGVFFLMVLFMGVTT